MTLRVEEATNTGKISRSMFCQKHKKLYFKLTELIDSGDITLYLIGSRLLIDEEEALRAYPTAKQRRAIVLAQEEAEKIHNDLFA
jgi:hypothetical protein